MAEESDLEKTESPSQQRLEKAREEGQGPTSRDLSAFMVTGAGVAMLWVTGPWMAHRLQSLVRDGLSFGTVEAHAPDALGRALSEGAQSGVFTLLPIAIGILLAAIAARLLLGFWVFSSKGFMPNFSRLDPLAGLARLFSLHGLVELVKAILAAALVGGLGVWVMLDVLPRVLDLGKTSLEFGLPGMAQLLLQAAAFILCGLALLALLDAPYQLWRFYSQLKMTRQEIRDEMREAEGDPHIKARIRSLQREMARKRMMEAVPKADVIVTNPTHYAVAIQYDPARMGAPVVVAKGANHIAHNIRALGEEHQVPVMEAPPLARALYRHVELEAPIPASLYHAVAEVLAYVFQLREFTRKGGLPPTPPTRLDIPAGLDPGASL